MLFANYFSSVADSSIISHKLQKELYEKIEAEATDEVQFLIRELIEKNVIYDETVHVY